jgi:predicted phage terminase large subunit-like protein
MSLAAAIEAEIARRRLLPFATRVVLGYVPAEHLELLCCELERVERGEVRRLMISAPPGHGKSTAVQAFVAWFLGRQARRRVLMISASDGLARRNSRVVRDLVSSDWYPWPASNFETEAINEWELSNGSGVRAIGVGGVVTGFRCECIVLDDVQPDRGSKSTRDTLEEYWREIASTRLEPGGIVVCIATRWGQDDFIARLLAGEGGASWRYINLPAISEGDGDPLARPEGAALWPARWSLELLKQKRAEVGSSAFDSQFQGAPVPDGGLLFKNDWLEHRYNNAPDFVKTAAGLDSAWKVGVSHDRSAAVLVGVDDKGHFYVHDAWAARVAYPDLKARVGELNAFWKPTAWPIEDAASGMALLAELKETRVPAIAMSAGGKDKISRAEQLTPLFESGKVHFRSEPAIVPLLAELNEFPGGRHDDMVDALLYAIQYLNRPRSKRIWDSVQARRAPVDWHPGLVG